MHGEGRASAEALANAVYHGAHAQRSYEHRWTLTGYATHGVLGSAVGFALLLARRRRGAGSRRLLPTAAFR